MTDDDRRVPLAVGDRVRVDIVNENDPDHQYHGQNGEILDIIPDDASSVTGDTKDDNIYRVQVDSGSVIDLRARDLRPPI